MNNDEINKQIEYENNKHNAVKDDLTGKLDAEKDNHKKKLQYYKNLKQQNQQQKKNEKVNNSRSVIESLKKVIDTALDES